jgi:predicted nucleic acid-binding protein
MSGDSCFVDTNVLLYASDPVQGRKHDVAKSLVEDLWTSQTGVISTQVLQEFCFNLRRKVRPRLSIVDTTARVRDYLNWPIVINVAESTIAALEIEAKYQISFWDSLIVHAAQTAGCTILYSEDLNHEQIFDAVRVVNPFVGQQLTTDFPSEIQFGYAAASRTMRMR